MQKRLPASLAGLAVIILLIGGCKKDLGSPEGSGGPELTNLTLQREGKGKQKVLRLSPSVKVKVKSPIQNTVTKMPKGIERMASILKEDQSRKKSQPGITTSSVDFTATLHVSGTFYSCSGEVDDPGATNWWLINTYTWVMTPLGQTSGNTISFYVDKPDLYGSYRLWGENVSTSSGAYTGYQSMGDTYSGVSLSGGVMNFTNISAYNTILTRLKTAYANHQTHIDLYDSWSNDNANAQLISDGFEEFLPFEEFEAHFGFSSLRASIESEVQYWLTQSHYDASDYPEVNYLPYPYANLTLMNTSGQVNSDGDGGVTLPIYSGTKVPANPGPSTCVSRGDKNSSDITLSSNPDKKLKLFMAIDPKDEDGNLNTNFNGRSITLKKVVGAWWRTAERQRVRISGNYYNGCTLEDDFDSGLTNPDNLRRRSEEIDHPVGPNRTTKEYEFTVHAQLSDYSSSAYSFTYTH